MGAIGRGKQNPEAKGRHNNVFLRSGDCQVIHNNNGYSHDTRIGQDIEDANDSPESRLSTLLKEF